MKKVFLFLIVMVLSNSLSYSQRKPANYDEAKVPPYELPNVMKCNSNNEVVTTAREWEEYRRPEIMKLFTNKMYGVTPNEKIDVTYEVLTENSEDLNGKATSKQVRFIFTDGKKEVEALLLMYIPNLSERKVPVFVGYNFKGNHSTTLDSTILYPPLFHLVKEPDHPDWQRGVQTNRWPIEKIIDRGYALATMCYHDIFPDKAGLKEYSIASLFSNYSSHSSTPEEWEAIGAWAWGSSRIVDYLELHESMRVDVDKIAIMGHSRQGKAALWAGAQDNRFKIVISNNSGCGGAALSKRIFGETVAVVSAIQPPWFCEAFNQYRHKEETMPFDQHQLLALIAPRKLYVASA